MKPQYSYCEDRRSKSWQSCAWFWAWIICLPFVSLFISTISIWTMIFKRQQVIIWFSIPKGVWFASNSYPIRTILLDLWITVFKEGSKIYYVWSLNETIRSLPSKNNFSIQEDDCWIVWVKPLESLLRHVLFILWMCEEIITVQLLV